MADIIEFARRMTSPGNGALEKMREYFATGHDWSTHIPAMTEADYFLAWLWLEGFKVAPLDAAGDRDLMLAELRRLFELYGHQATADVLRAVGSPPQPEAKP